MARKINLSQLTKATVAYAAISGLTVDISLAFTDSAGLVDVPGQWYYQGPLLAWALAGVPVSIKLASRMLQQIDSSPGAIIADVQGNGPRLRKIPFGARGQTGAIFANTIDSIFGHHEIADSQGRDRRPAVWRVPVNEIPVTVRETELRVFLDVCYRRKKYQFSRNYWTKRRRPPMWEGKYSAFMRLLVESGLVEGRQFGASGRLVLFPREAISYLKYESKFAV